MDKEQQRIDELLERYLGLLDEYTQLRDELSKVQGSIYQNIARANFAGERGMRYGQDHYDERMRALRVLSIEVEESGVPVYSMVNVNKASDGQSVSPAKDDADEDSEAQHGSSSNDDSTSTHQKDTTNTEDENQQTKTDTDSGESHGQEDEKPQGKKEKEKRRHDPLHWFGLFAPTTLRTAQAQSIEAVEHSIMRLASVNAEMASVEIEVRRARKRRTKAIAATAAAKEAEKVDVEDLAMSAARLAVQQDRARHVEAT